MWSGTVVPPRLSVWGEAGCMPLPAWLVLLRVKARHQGEEMDLLTLWSRESFMSLPACLVLLWVLVR